MKKYVVLVSHPFYGSTYLTKNKNEYLNLTKDRNEAQTFDTIAEADIAAKQAEAKFQCNCDWNILN